VDGSRLADVNLKTKFHAPTQFFSFSNHDDDAAMTESSTLYRRHPPLMSFAAALWLLEMAITIMVITMRSTESLCLIVPMKQQPRPLFPLRCSLSSSATSGHVPRTLMRRGLTLYSSNDHDEDDEQERIDNTNWIVSSIDHHPNDQSTPFNMEYNTSRASTRSLHQLLLHELDRRNIRYPPTASRLELKQLLWRESGLNNNNNDDEKTKTTNSFLNETVLSQPPPQPHPEHHAVNNHEGLPCLSSSSSSSLTDAIKNQTAISQQLSLPQLLQRLDEQNIRYLPSDTRAELEQRLFGNMIKANDEYDDDDDDNKEPRNDLDGQACVHTEPRQEDDGRSDERSSLYSKKANIILETKLSSHLSLSQLLKQLDEQGIRYPPSASRADLENLWNSHNMDELLLRQDEEDWMEHPVNDCNRDNVKTKQKHYTTNMPIREYAKTLPLTQLLKQLDEQGIRYPPSATRADLEQLWLDIMQGNLNQSKESHFTTSTTTTTKRHPSATDVPTDASGSSEGNVKARESVDDDAETLALLEKRRKRRLRRRRRQDRDKPPLRKFLSKTKTTTLSASNGISRQVVRISQKAVRQFHHVAEQAQKLLAVDENDEKMLLPSDDNGVRDVDYKYVRKFETDDDDGQPIDVTAVPLEKDGRSPRSATASTFRRPNRSTGFERQSPRKRPFDRVAKNDRSYNNNNNNNNNKSNARKRNPDDSNVPRSEATSPTSFKNIKNAKPMLRLPPSNDGNFKKQEFQFPRVDQDDRRQNRRRTRSTTSGATNQRIYSPYRSVNQQEDFDGRDAFDRFGDFVAQAAESVLWGPDDENNRPPSDDDDATDVRQRRGTRERPPKPVKERTRETMNTPSSDTSEKKSARSAARTIKKPGKKYWKDRLAESFDYLLGLHEDGAYYNSWQKQLDLDRQDEGGYDSLSVAQGRAPKNKRKPHHNKPFWEEEGSLISLLFGRTQSGNSLFFEVRFAVCICKL
jgi:hypothetical protein